MEYPENILLTDLSHESQPASLQVRLGRITLSLAEISLGLAIVLSPWRLAVYRLERPVSTVYGDYTDFIFYLSDVFVILAGLLWLISTRFQDTPFSLGPDFLVFPIAGIFLAALISIPFSTDRVLSTYHFVRLSGLALLALLAKNQLANLRKLVLPAAILVLVQASIGIVQVLNQSSLGLARLGELELDPAWLGVSIVSTTSGRFLRLYGLSDHPNVLAGVLAFGLILIAAGYSRIHPLWRPAMLAAFFIGLLGLLLTFSRSAWLGFSLSLAVGFSLAIFSRRKKLAAQIASLSIAGIFLLAPFIWRYSPLILVRMNHAGAFRTIPEEKISLDERGVLIQAAGQVFRNHPLIGVGLGTLPLAIQDAFPQFPYDYQPAHNVLITAGAETGLTGALFSLLALITPWIALWHFRRRLLISPQLIGFSALLAAIAVIGLLDYYLWSLAPGRFWQFLAWGLWAGAFEDALVRESNV